MSASSAPGKSLHPPPRTTHGTASNISRNVVSEVQTTISDIRHVMKSGDGQQRSVSVTHVSSVTEYTLTIA